MAFIKIRRKLISWLQGEDRPIVTAKKQSFLSTDAVSKEPNQISAKGKTFSVFPAAGGLVGQVQSVNDHYAAPHSGPRLHMVADTDDLSTALSHILTVESMR